MNCFRITARDELGHVELHVVGCSKDEPNSVSSVKRLVLAAAPLSPPCFKAGLPALWTSVELFLAFSRSLQAFRSPRRPDSIERYRYLS